MIGTMPAPGKPCETDERVLALTEQLWPCNLPRRPRIPSALACPRCAPLIDMHDAAEDG